MRVEDKNIELATGQTTATDAFIDGGGITLKGTTDKTWQYNNSNNSKAWQSNINIDLLTTSSSLDLREEFLNTYILPAIQANAIYENLYLMGTSLARPCIAKRAVEIAHKMGCGFVAHGATGKGNDQVRFELTFAALDPGLQAIVPWRDPAFFNKFQGRGDLLEYAAKHGVPVVQTKAKPYS